MQQEKITIEIINHFRLCGVILARFNGNQMTYARSTEKEMIIHAEIDGKTCWKKEVTLQETLLYLRKLNESSPFVTCRRPKINHSVTPQKKITPVSESARQLRYWTQASARFRVR
jgi:reverse gyrase